MRYWTSRCSSPEQALLSACCLALDLVLSARTHSHRKICSSSSADGLTARECRSPASKNRHLLKEFKPCTVLTLARHRCTESYSLSLSSHLLATNFKFKVYFQPFLKPVFRTTQHSCDLPMTAQLLNFKGKWTGTALYWKRTAHIKPWATFKPLKFSASYSYIPCFSAFSVSLFITQVLLYQYFFLAASSPWGTRRQQIEYHVSLYRS